jgi:hypothetical protein
MFWRIESLFIMPEIKPQFLDYSGPSLAIILKTQPVSWSTEV